MHSRHHAAGRTYVYRIVSPVSMHRLSIFEYNRCWACERPLDVAAMREAAGHLMGKHDFSTFRAAGAERPRGSLPALHSSLQASVVVASRPLHSLAAGPSSTPAPRNPVGQRRGRPGPAACPALLPDDLSATRPACSDTVSAKWRVWSGAQCCLARERWGERREARLGAFRHLGGKSGVQGARPRRLSRRSRPWRCWSSPPARTGLRPAP